MCCFYFLIYSLAAIRKYTFYIYVIRSYFILGWQLSFGPLFKFFILAGVINLFMVSFSWVIYQIEARKLAIILIYYMCYWQNTTAQQNATIHTVHIFETFQKSIFISLNMITFSELYTSNWSARNGDYFDILYVLAAELCSLTQRQT